RAAVAPELSSIDPQDHDHPHGEGACDCLAAGVRERGWLLRSLLVAPPDAETHHWREMFRPLPRWPVAVLGALLLAAALGWTPASAQSIGYDNTDGCSGSWQQQFGINVLVLDCQPGYASGHDRAYMYPRQPVDPRADWRAQMDFTNALWIFDA